MPDKNEFDDIERQKTIRNKIAEIRRMTNAMEDNKDRIFFMESDIIKLKESIIISEKEIENKKKELNELKN